MHDTSAFIKQDSSIFIAFIQQYNNIPNLTFILGVQGYPDPQYTSTTDIFCYLTTEQLVNLQHDVNTFFIFDSSMEGFIPTVFFELLYYNCEKYNIHPNKIIFVTGNTASNSILIDFNTAHNINTSIHIFSYLTWKHFIVPQLITICSEQNLDITSSEHMLTYNINKVKNKYTDKYFLSLSMRPREHRNILQFLLSTDKLFNNHTIISQSILDTELQKYMEIYNITDKHTIKQWSKTLPIIADDINIEMHHATELHADLLQSTLFQIVGETWADYDMAELFYSEKTFRAIACMQPFIIFGQQFCNIQLTQFGFKLFPDMFDYSFDSEPDTAKRVKMIHTEICRVVKLLNTMNREQQIEWRFQNADILCHNYNLLFIQQYELKQIRKLFDSLQNI